MIIMKINAKALKDTIENQCQEIQQILENNFQIQKPKINIHFKNCLFASAKWMKNEEIKTLLMNERHYEITTVISERIFPYGIGPWFRENIDCVIISYTATIPTEMLHRLYTFYFSNIFENFETFKTCFDHLQISKEILFLDKTTTPKNILDHIFLFKNINK